MSTTRDEYVAKLQAKLDRWNAEIDEIEAKAKQRKALADERNAERLADLKRKRDELRGKLEEVRAATGDAWESLKSGADKLWDDITLTLQETKVAFVEGLEDDGKPGA